MIKSAGDMSLCVVSTHVVDLDSEGREGRGIIRNREEARVEADLASCGCQGESAARVSEARLGDCMILLVELECDRIADLRSNVRRVVEEFASPANNDRVVRASCGSRLSGSWEGTVRRGDRLATPNCQSGSDSLNTRCGRSSRRGRSGSSSTPLGVCLECGELRAWVDGEDHALLTVVCLATVDPDGVGVLDGDLSLGEGASGIIVCNGLAAWRK